MDSSTQPATTNGTGGEKEQAKPATLSLFTDPFQSVLDVTSQAAEAAKQSASLFLMGFGVALMLLAVLTEIGFGDYQLAQLDSGEFMAVLFSGLLILLIGAVYGMYSSWVVDSAQREKAKWVRDRAALEADVQIERAKQLNAEAIKDEEDVSSESGESDRVKG
jgi:hypothetical protein